MDDMAISQTQVSQTQAFDPQPQESKQDGVVAHLVSTVETSFKFMILAEHTTLLIGRHPSCQIQVKDKHVSSQHLKIYRDEERRYFIEELGTSGCFINDQFMKKGEHRALTHGDTITIGEQPEGTGDKKPFASYIFRVAGRKGSGECNSPNSKGERAVTEKSSGPGAAAATGGESGAAGGAMTTTATTTGGVPTRNGVTEEWVRANWDVSHVLGSGNFSEVRLAVNVKKGQKFAMKIIDTKKFIQFQNKRNSQLCLSDEADVLRRLQHPNILRCFEWFQTEVHLYLVTELVGGGDLLQCILEGGCFLERQAKRLFKQLCEAVQYLHLEMNIIHRDLKPENVLLTSRERDTMDAKIADFGLARKNMTSRDCRTFCGTPHYFAPEVINTFKDMAQGNKAGYGRQADMWSLGVILYILLSGIPPFEEENLYAQITEGKYEFDVQEWTTVSLEAKELVKCLMTVNPKDRLTIEQTLEHKWLCFTGMCSPTKPPTDKDMLVGALAPQKITFQEDTSEPVAKRRKSDVTMLQSPGAEKLGA